MMNVLFKIGFVLSVVILLITGYVIVIYRSDQVKDSQSVSYCYAQDPSPPKRFSTKTVYDFDKHRNTRKPTLPTNCKPVKLWTVIRHGIRLQQTDEVQSLQNDLPKMQQEIVENYEKKTYKSGLCEQDFNNIRNWKLDSLVSVDNSFRLSDSGAQQMAELADRFRRDYSSLFDFPCSDKNYLVHSFLNIGVTKSRNIFLDRIFNYTCSKNLKEISLVYDERFSSSMDFPEADRFTETLLVQEMLLNIGEKLGYNATRLNWTSVKLMYDMCRYDNAWQSNKLSPWCAVFTAEQNRLFEYHEDLSCYYEYGYGNQNSKYVGCRMIKSMIYYFMDIASSELNEPKAILIFTHRGAMEALFVILNAKKDPYVLRGDNFEYATNRKWKTSDNIPFSAHVTVTFYSCDDNGKYVQFILNEEPLELDFPGCVQGICPWQSVLLELRPALLFCK
ncbi:multiple inositol polyphosphate phosphatase 1-like [Chrysoperla carnea]|uniref:multiple inositol polyphosphate phosphatase 1-like n=1 Tax=Chrysoperla carnea TaxID=189513 RepID=UPI001D076533|nr:multiple inositol polyphosphate phosphatase 1-like [Chrysoperla carnea]